MTHDESHESPNLDRIQPRTDCAVACIMLHDSHGRITHVNEAFREMFRMPPGQVIGRLPEMLAAPGSTEGDAHNRRVMEAADRDGAVSFERVGVRADETRFIYRATVTVLPTGRSEGGYCSVMEDITAEREAADALRSREAILEVVSLAARRLLGMDNWRDGIGETLARLGRATRASRVYIFENHPADDGELLFSERYEWVADGIKPQINDPRHQNIAHGSPDRARMAEIMAAGDIVNLDLAEMNEAERAAQESQGVKSLLKVPVFVKERWWGYIGFDECGDERKWTDAEIGALKIAADILGEAITRTEAEAALAQANVELETKVRRRTAELAATNEKLQRELTERHRAEQALRESERRYRNLVENATDMIYTLDMEGRLTYVSSALLWMLDRGADELLGQHASVIIAPEDQVVTLECFNARLRGERVPPYEFHLVARDGRRIPIEIVGNLVYNELGAQIGIQAILRDMTERHRTEEALRESEQRLHQILDVARDIVLKFDLAKRAYEYISPAVLQITGFTQAEFLAMSPAESRNRLHPEDREEFIRDWAAQLAGEASAPLTVEYRWRHKDGHYIWLSNVRTVARDTEGRPVAIIASIHDATARKLAEQALRESEQRFRLILDVARDIIIKLDLAKGAYEYISPATLQITGFTQAESLAMGPAETRDRVHPEDREKFDRDLAAQLAGEASAPLAVEYRWRHKDGHYVWLSDVRTVLRDAEGRPVAVIASIHDATARKLAEEALRESERRFRQIFEASRDAIYRRDLATGLLDYISPAAKTVMGFTEAELVNQTFEQALERFHPDDRERSLKVATAQRDGTIDESMLPNVEFRWLHKDGTYHWLSDSHTLVRDEQGKPVALTGSLRDITERKEVDERVRRMAERAVETLEAERNHVSRELHDELGQDLVALKLDAAALANAAEPLDAALAERARQMGKLVDWTIGIIRRMASDLRPPALDDLGLADAIEWLAAQVATRAELNCQISVEPEDLRVPPAVATTAYRIVQESLTNIVKHANAHNIQIHLTLDRKWLTIIIEDDGRGWPTNGIPDDGIGLRGMRERASLLGGALDVEISDSGGACIKATLPTDSFEHEEKR